MRNKITRIQEARIKSHAVNILVVLPTVGEAEFGKEKSTVMFKVRRTAQDLGMLHAIGWTQLDPECKVQVAETLKSMKSVIQDQHSALKKAGVDYWELYKELESICNIINTRY